MFTLMLGDFPNSRTVYRKLWDVRVERYGEKDRRTLEAYFKYIKSTPLEYIKSLEVDYFDVQLSELRKLRSLIGDGATNLDLALDVECEIGNVSISHFFPREIFQDALRQLKQTLIRMENLYGTNSPRLTRILKLLARAEEQDRQSGQRQQHGREDMKTDNSKTLKKLLGGDLMPDGLIEDEAVYADWLSPLESLDESDRLLARILICWRLSLAGQAGNLDAKTAAGDLRRRITQEIRSDCNLRCGFGLPIKSAYSLFGRQAFTLRQIRESFGRDTYPHFFSNEDVGPLMTFPNPDQPIILPFLIYDLQGIARVFIKNFAEDLRGDPAYEALVDKITNSLGDDSDDPAPSLLDKELQDHVTKKYQNWRNFYSKATYVDVNESWAYGREPAENWAILKFLPDGTRGHEAYKDELEKFNEVTGFLELLRTGRHFDAATFLLTTRVNADRTSRLLRLICWAIPEIGGDCKETLKILEKIVGDDVWWEDPFRIPH
ncbi:MAG: hypothetical protein WCO71_10305, partial [Pseudomonadota bacterium]